VTLELLCASPYYSSATLQSHSPILISVLQKKIRQYSFAVLQRTTPVLLCSTEYYFCTPLKIIYNARSKTIHPSPNTAPAHETFLGSSHFVSSCFWLSPFMWGGCWMVLCLPRLLSAPVTLHREWVLVGVVNSAPPRRTAEEKCTSKCYASITFCKIGHQYCTSTTPVPERTCLNYKVPRQCDKAIIHYCSVLHTTIPTTAYDSTVLQFYSVLQSSTSTLQCSVWLQSSSVYFFELQSTTPLLKYYYSTNSVTKNYTSTTLHFKARVQNFSKLQRTWWACLALESITSLFCKVLYHYHNIIRKTITSYPVLLYTRQKKIVFFCTTKYSPNINL